MLRQREQKLVVDLLSLPTAPFTEEAIRAFVVAFCARRSGVRVTEDRAGNILVHYHRGRRRRPVCLCAHMDHPGFRAGRMVDDRVLQARWLGGVPHEYFEGSGVRFYSGGTWVRGTITRTTLKTLGLERPRRMVDTVEVTLRGRGADRVEPDAPGMWDLPDPVIRGSRIHARACDDLAGCAAMLICLDRLVRRNVRTEGYFLFTRAEEVGFIGAIAACRAGTIPQRCLVVAIETSSALPGVEMGGGPILRVGDKSSVFTPQLTAWCGRVADDLVARQSGFKYQRKLMDGGSCESSAYCQLGYDATGLCVALGNYHNCDRQRRRIAAEIIDLNDLAGMVQWFEALLQATPRLDAADQAFRKRLGTLERRYRTLLNQTAPSPTSTAR